MAAVADAGPLIHLDELDALPLLAGFTEVLVPGIVFAEVSRHRSAWTDRAPSCLREADPNPQTLKALRNEAISAELDPGELSALALWRDHPDFILLCDDLAARRTAEQLGCEFAGTLASSCGPLEAAGFARKRPGLSFGQSRIRRLFIFALT